MDHIDDAAELYALGLLEPAERARIDEHAYTCDPCAQRLGRAEGAVAALVATSQRRRIWRFPSWPIAVAAAFALTSGVLMEQNLALRGAVTEDGRSYDSLVNSHFAHVQFTSPAGEPVAAKAIYEQHGRWFQIVAVRPPDWHVTLIGPDGKREAVAERPVARGAASLLMLNPIARVTSIELADADGHTIARAKPALIVDKD